MKCREWRRIVVSLMLASGVAVTGCRTDRTDPTPSDAGDQAQAFRCRIAQPDGTCDSTPANCPVSLPTSHLITPHCNQGELIPIEQDNCAHKFICVD